MAVADIFCAITENRPYRQGMDGQQVLNIFDEMVAGGALDPKIVENVKLHFTQICDLRDSTENEAVVYYENYMKSK
jgi:HD-GYP domain-containing protein (c-di-GMP phosphodiesterase class II)